MKRPVFSRVKTKTRTLDDKLTPLEIAALLRRPLVSHLPFAIAPLLSDRPPVRYVRSDLCEYVHFYSANRGAPNLIVAFCGSGHRLMMPVSYFLQLMQDDFYDVLLLADVQRRHFDGGIPGFSSSLVETLQRIRAFLETRSYRGVIAFGTSMGGFPALRAGLWLGANRAISIGGGFCSHPLRLLRMQHEMRAFDLICACRPTSNVPLLAVFASSNTVDARQYEVLRQVLPHCVPMKIEAEVHNVLKHLDRNGRLSSFFAEIFAL
jgi:hypothetical protein